MTVERCCSHEWIQQRRWVTLPKLSWSDRNGDTITVDACLAGTVQAIWDAGYITLSSCCGHDEGAPSFVLGNSSDGTPEIVAAIREIIHEVDGREFTLYQWQLVELDAAPDGSVGVPQEPWPIEDSIEDAYAAEIAARTPSEEREKEET